MKIVAHCISTHEQTQLNQVCCFLILEVISISEGSFFPDYLEEATTVVVSVWSWLNFSQCIDIMLILFLYSGPLGITGSDGKQNTA